MRKIMPLIFLMSILVIGTAVQGIALGQATPTNTSPPTETPTNTLTSTATFTLTPTFTETPTPTTLPTETPTAVVTETTTLTPTVEAGTSTPTETGTVTGTPIATGTFTPTAAVGTATSTLLPTLTPPVTPTALPTGLTRMFFFQGLSDSNVDIYANGLQLGGNVEAGRMLGSFVLLDRTATSLLIFPAGNLAQPTLFSTLTFDPGSTVLVVAFNGVGGTPTLVVYRLVAAPGQSQLIAINASDAPALNVATSSYPTMSLAQGYSTQITLTPGNTAGLTAAEGSIAAQTGLPQRTLSQGVAYVQIAVGSVANGTFRVITQAIDLNTLTPVTP